MNGIFCVDILEHIFRYCLSRDQMLMCKHWQNITLSAIKAGRYAAAIKAHMNPADLPIECWPYMSIEQRAALPMDIRRRDAIPDLCELRIRPKYRIAWYAIMFYCNEIRDSNWLFREWEEYAYSKMNIFEILFLEYEQFRDIIRHGVCPSDQINCLFARIAKWPIRKIPIGDVEIIKTIYTGYIMNPRYTLRPNFIGNLSVVEATVSILRDRKCGQYSICSLESWTGGYISCNGDTRDRFMRSILIKHLLL